MALQLETQCTSYVLQLDGKKIKEKSAEIYRICVDLNQSDCSECNQRGNN